MNPQPMQSEQQGLADFQATKYGFFVHYVFGNGVHPDIYTLYPDGSIPADLNELVEAFDVEAFARELSSFGIEYVIFTAWHANMNMLYPSEVMSNWLGAEHTTRRDLISDMIDAVRACGIRVLLYTHPRVGHDFSEEDAVATGWGAGGGAYKPDPNPDTFDAIKWNCFVNEIYAELVERYGHRIHGLYLDEGSSKGDSDRLVDYPRLRQTIKGRHPHLVLLQNDYGNRYTADILNKEYSYWGEFESTDGMGWPTYTIPVSTVMGGQFWSLLPQGQTAVKFAPEAMFRYTVMQAGANSEGGGTCWAAGPYVGGVQWEDGVVSTMRQLAAYLAPIEISIKNTYASRSFPTLPGMTFATLAWGVATESIDGAFEYVHVLKPPAGKTLLLPVPADGKRFLDARLLVGSQKVKLETTGEGIRLELPESQQWDELDTVIEMRVAR